MWVYSKCMRFSILLIEGLGCDKLGKKDLTYSPFRDKKKTTFDPYQQLFDFRVKRLLSLEVRLCMVLVLWSGLRMSAEDLLVRPFHHQ